MKKSKILLIAAPLALLPAVYLLRELYLSYVVPHMGGCLFRTATGFYCTGCGNTRAVNAILAGHFLESVLYNPMPLVLLIIAAVHYICTLAGKKPLMGGKFILITMSVLFVYYALRNFIPLSPYLPPVR